MNEFNPTADWTVEQHIEWIRQQAGAARYLNEQWLNVQLSTWEHYSLGSQVHTLTVEGTNEKFRALGFIK